MRGQLHGSLKIVTTVGHSLTGLSIAVLTLPRGKSLGWYLLVGQFYLFFTNLPDFPIPGWGHSNYQVSHSLFVTLLLVSLLCLLLLWPTVREQVRARIFLAWSITWLSHMPLDSLYNHGRGIAIFWPFSDAHLAMPVSWFQTISLPPFTESNLRVFGIEALVYGIVFIVCITIRRFWLKPAVS